MEAKCFGPFSFELPSGAMVHLSGSSGSGKTIFLRTICQMDRLESGDIEFLEKPVTNFPLFRSQVVYVAPTVSFLQPSIERVLTEAFEYRAHKDKKYDRTKAIALMKEFGLPDDFLQTPLSRISQGEAQRLNLIRALILDPNVLLLDEPTANLDESRRKKIENYMGDWVSEALNRAVIWVSHESFSMPTQMTHQWKIQEGGLVQ